MSTASKLEEAEHKVQALQTGLAWLLCPFPGGQVGGERTRMVGCVRTGCEAALGVQGGPAELRWAL